MGLTPRQRPFVIIASMLVAVGAAGGAEIWLSTGWLPWAVRFVVVVVLVSLSLLMRGLVRPAGRVLKHTPCGECSRQILFEHEAEICPLCDAGLHARCIDEHRSKRHAAGPFR